jgi:hypothetical protein
MLTIIVGLLIVYGGKKRRVLAGKKQKPRFEIAAWGCFKSCLSKDCVYPKLIAAATCRNQ